MKEGCCPFNGKGVCELLDQSTVDELRPRYGEVNGIFNANRDKIIKCSRAIEAECSFSQFIHRYKFKLPR